MSLFAILPVPLFIAGCLFLWLAIKRKNRVFLSLGIGFMFNALMNGFFYFLAAR